MRNAGSNATYDAWIGSDPIAVGGPAPLTVSRLTASPMPDYYVRNPVTIRAQATGGVGPYTYAFFVYDGTSWTTGRDWSTSGTWSWVPATAGSYVVQAWARNAGSSATYDAWSSLGSLTVQPDALTVDDVTISPTGSNGTATVRARASGGLGPTSFRFLLYNVFSNEWSIGRDWGASPVWLWSDILPKDLYVVQVWARNAGSSAAYDAWNNSRPVDMPIATLQISPEPPVLTGSPAVITATAAGGVLPYAYKFTVTEAFGGATIQCDWSPSNTCTWVPSHSGEATVQVDVRDATGFNTVFSGTYGHSVGPIPVTVP